MTTGRLATQCIIAKTRREMFTTLEEERRLAKLSYKYPFSNEVFVDKIILMTETEAFILFV